MDGLQLNGDLVAVRRERAKLLAEQGHTPSRIAEMLAGDGILNPDTGKPFALSTIRRDLETPGAGDGASTYVDIAEMIGRNERERFYRQYMPQFTIDPHRTDYRWYDLFRLGKQPGFELSGLFARPIAEIIGYYSLGTKPQYKLDTSQLDDLEVSKDNRLHTNRMIQEWIGQNINILLNMLVEEYCLGDQFVFMNLDGSLTIPSPDTVRVIRDLTEPERIVEVVVTTKYEATTVEEHYTDFLRTRITRVGANPPVFEDFDNVLGVIPMVIFSCNKSGNELYGHPIFEALIGGTNGVGGLFQWYNELLLKSLEGMRILGNPIPAFEKVENVQATIDANQPATPTTYEDGYGATVTRNEIAFDANGAIVTSGDFNLKTPPVGFSTDMENIGRRLDLMIYSHTHIPEFLWGGAVEASKASTEVQTPPFVVYIGGTRIHLDGSQVKRDGMLALINLLLRVKRLTDPKVHVGNVVSRYQAITVEQDQIKLQKAIFASNEENPLIDDIETLTLLDISDDPTESVEKAKAERKQKLKEQQELMVQQQENDFQTALNDAARKEMNPEKDVQSPAGGKQGAAA